MSASTGTERALWGLVAEFASADELKHAAARVRDAGYVRLDDAMGVRPTRLPWLVLGAGITGCLGGIVMQWWMNAIDYPIIISGKPFFSLPANIPVAFELTILLASLTAFLSMLIANALPQLYHPLFKNERFRKVTTDAFFIAIESKDPRFDVEETDRLLRGAGSTHVAWIED
jgi:hypothetical protein